MACPHVSQATIVCTWAMREVPSRNDFLGTQILNISVCVCVCVCWDFIHWVLELMMLWVAFVHDLINVVNLYNYRCFFGSKFVGITLG